MVSFALEKKKIKNTQGITLKRPENNHQVYKNNILSAKIMISKWHYKKRFDYLKLLRILYCVKLENLYPFMFYI